MLSYSGLYSAQTSTAGQSTQSLQQNPTTQTPATGQPTRTQADIDDEEYQRLVDEQMKLAYQPPFHLGINFGLGLSSSNVPDGFQSSVKMSFQGSLIGTYYFVEFFALYTELGWMRLSGVIKNDTYNTAYNLDIFTFKFAPLFYYKEGFAYFGLFIGTKLNATWDNRNINNFSNYNYAARDIVGITMGFGWRVDLLYKLRFMIKLDFSYGFTSWLKPNYSDWKIFGVYLNFGFMFGIGS